MFLYNSKLSTFFSVRMLSKYNGISYSSAVFVLRWSKSERGVGILIPKRSPQLEQNNKELKVGEALVKQNKQHEVTFVCIFFKANIK